MIGVVIPTRNEEHELPRTLAELLRNPPCLLDVTVADGGSLDRTREVAAGLGVRVITSAPGRGAQMNAGARATAGDPLLFLHADTGLGRAHLEAVLATVADPRVTHGSFPIGFEEPGLGLRLIAAVANLRTRLDRTPYGDQALFVRRAAFEAAGGFPEIPIMEDMMLGRILRRQRGRFVFLGGPPVRTSSRRWQRGGLVSTSLRNWATRALWELGVRPDWLRGYYDRPFG